MKRRGFTLLELLVVMGIMGFMGTLAVGGYRAMQRGMEERSVMQNVNQFIRSAYQRAQIDRQPVAVFFWNETLRAESADALPIVVGKAVAVRRSGRLTKVQGTYLYDEFGDRNDDRNMQDDDEDLSSERGGSDDGVALYRMNGDEGNRPMRSVVSSVKPTLPVSDNLVDGTSVQIRSLAFVQLDAGGVGWRAGDAYGFEFAEIQLPHGYLFGSTWSKTVTDPVAGETVIRFKVSANSGNGANQGTVGSSTVTVSSLRPNASGALQAQRVATSDSPTKTLNN